MPASSCPGTCGSATGSPPRQACQSLRQTPVAATRIDRRIRRAFRYATSRRVGSSSYASKTTARIVDEVLASDPEASTSHRARMPDAVGEVVSRSSPRRRKFSRQRKDGAWIGYEWGMRRGNALTLLRGEQCPAAADARRHFSRVGGLPSRRASPRQRRPSPHLRANSQTRRRTSPANCSHSASASATGSASGSVRGPLISTSRSSAP